MTTIQVILGTTREGRFSDRVAAWVTGYLRSHTDFRVELLDLRDYPLPMFDQASPPAYTGRDYPNEAVARLGRAIDEADGYVVLVGEYNHGYPAVLKNAIDYTFVEWNRKPITFVGWGNVGGARAIEQLREVAIELEMAPLRRAVHILPNTMRAARATESSDDLTPFDDYEPKIEAMATELQWWATTLTAGREGTIAPADAR